MLNIIIPIAGASDFFEKNEYQYPKPLVEVDGKMMIARVIENIRPILSGSRVIFIVKNDDIIKYHIDNTLKLLTGECHIVKINRPTKGALCSVMLTIDLIDSNDDVLILNGDQVIEANYDLIHNSWCVKKVDAGVVTFNSAHPRWSYVLFEGEMIIQAAEKNPISNFAIAGYYYFSKAADFFSLAFKAISDDDSFDGNFYISSVLNQYILTGKTIGNYHLDDNKYHSFYSPRMIERFEKAK